MIADKVWNATRGRWETFMGEPITVHMMCDDAFLAGMREAARLCSEDDWKRATCMILEEVARRAKSGNVRQKTGLAERSDPEAQATPVKQGEAS